MNEKFLDVILARRSIRRFENKPVEQEKIKKIIECAAAAPSACNAQPWHFVAVTERDSLNKLAEIHPFGKMMFEATLAIVVCGDPDKHEACARYWEEDCSAAMQNVLLASTALGLGSVWLGVKRSVANLEDAFRRQLGIPSSIQVLGIAAIGYGKEEKEPHSGIPAGVLHSEKW